MCFLLESKILIMTAYKMTRLLRASEHRERSKHTVILSLRFLYVYIYIYSVTKILRKIRATTFTEKLRKITHEGDERLG